MSLHHSHTNHHILHSFIHTPIITYSTQSVTHQSSCTPLNHSHTNHQAHRPIIQTPSITHPTQSFTLQSSSTPLKQLHTNHQAHNSIIHTPTLMHAHRYTQSLTHQSSSMLKHSQTKQRVHHHLGSTKSVMVDGSLIGKVRLGERWMGGRGREGRGGMWARGGNMSMNRKLCECVCGE